MRDKVLAPSILSADFLELGQAVKTCVAAGISWFQLDVMDGHFVPNISFGPVIVKAVRQATDAFLDVHLMISNPNSHLQAFAEAGADLITVHAEVADPLQPLLAEIHGLGVRTGVALNPETPVETLDGALEETDLVLVMTVQPGFAGQSFIPGSPEKVARARAYLDERGSHADLQVDGGIGPETARQTAAAGANVFVAASAIFQHPAGITTGIQALQEAITGQG